MSKVFTPIYASKIGFLDTQTISQKIMGDGHE
jgi:hypothetical protein